LKKAAKTIIRLLWGHGVMVIGPEIMRECGYGNIKFGDSISGFFQKNIEANFSVIPER
jgi:hypothetical protein